MTDKDTFASRLEAALGSRYSPAMRRSVQTVVLYEANRCLKERYSSLRPFQRKIALYDTALDIINTLDFIPPYHRVEIMYRTATSKMDLSPELAWRRMRLIDRDVQKVIVPQIKPFLSEEKSHSDECNEFIQHQYEGVSGVKGKKHPAIWEYSHINIFLAYRMYYSGGSIDKNLPSAVDPNPNRVVPNKKPPSSAYDEGNGARGDDDDEASAASSPSLKNFAAELVQAPTAAATAPAVVAAQMPLTPAEERRLLLKEVRDHLELLKEFEGVISSAELNKRKVDLFLSLPPAPLVGNKREKKSEPTSDDDDDDEAPVKTEDGGASDEGKEDEENNTT